MATHPVWRCERCSYWEKRDGRKVASHPYPECRWCAAWDSERKVRGIAPMVPAVRYFTPADSTPKVAPSNGHRRKRYVVTDPREHVPEPRVASTNGARPPKESGRRARARHDPGYSSST